MHNFTDRQANLSLSTFFHMCCNHHFILFSGHLSAQRVALQVQQSGRKKGLSVASFIEELVVRRELTDNFCFYNKKYDSVEGQFRPHLIRSVLLTYGPYCLMFL